MSNESLNQIKAESSELYQGPITLPGSFEPIETELVLDISGKKVTIIFGESVADTTEWHGREVKVFKRLKFYEVQFLTCGIPKERITLTWKFNASLLDDSLAGVIIPRANDQRISGEKGFVLNKS